jgi:ABC-2 type transport system permease protein
LNSLTLAIVVSLLAYLLHFLIDLSLSYAAFWMDDVWALKHLKTVAMLVFSGMTFPLDLIPHSLKAIFNFLPFRFIYFFPITIARGNLTLNEFLTGFMQLIIWIFLFYIFAQFLWHRGLKRYQAYGN